MPCESVALHQLASMSKSPRYVLYEILTHADKCYLMCNILIHQEICVSVTGYTENMNSRFLLLLPTIFVIHCKSCEGQCSSNPCDNGGSCVTAGNAYTYNCPAGHTGPHCEGKNWALGKPATQSTTTMRQFDDPNFAVDGLGEQNFRQPQLSRQPQLTSIRGGGLIYKLC